METLVKTPIDYNIVRQKIKESKLKNIGKASIREVLALINNIEKATNIKFVRMEMGVPGLPACSIGIEAEKHALESGIASKYPNIEGLPELKNELSRFINLFLDIDVPSYCCFPCTGSTNGSFISFLVAARMYADKNTSLFLDPGFPVHKQQLSVLGLNQMSLDVYDYRGEQLKEKLESIFSAANISTVLYSNPNNPSWICFTDRELQIIGELSMKYNVIVLEDLAYFDMDFRKKYSTPGQPPFQPTVAKYTDKYILLISSSKIFSYAGQRIGSIAVSEKLFNTSSEYLLKHYTTDSFGHALIYGAAYAVSAGVTQSTQYALAAMLKAVNDGDYNFIEKVKVYGERAKIMKKMFTGNGFNLVYDKDDGEPIADGFYFTVSYPGFTGEELIEELLYYGISAISLSNTGSLRKEGIRACVSLVADSQLPDLEKRLKLFHENHLNI
jgi:aspartate/methionine/tyrosine aminotransferase